jgi:monofunctional chorismate mutase
MSARCGRRDGVILRKRIDRVDRRIMKLLQRRYELVRRIGRLKEERGLPLADPAREEEILSSIPTRVNRPGARRYVRSLYRTLFDLSKDVERRG